MNLVDYDDVVLAERRFGLYLSEEDALGEEEDLCVAGASLLEADLWFEFV
jgi:hypothetical protein